MPERLIDVPLESLPYVDENSVAVGASPERVWEAVLDVVAGTTGGWAGRRTATALGCFYTDRSGPAGRIGSTVPGFVVARSVAPAVLALMGEHRFSRYALVFRISETPLERAPVLLSAETRAVFPGRRGAAYRRLVIGTRGHVLVTRAMLRAVRRHAERRSPG